MRPGLLPFFNLLMAASTLSKEMGKLISGSTGHGVILSRMVRSTG